MNIIINILLINSRPNHNPPNFSTQRSEVFQSRLHYRKWFTNLATSWLIMNETCGRSPKHRCLHQSWANIGDSWFANWFHTSEAGFRYPSTQSCSTANVATNRLDKLAIPWLIKYDWILWETWLQPQMGPPLFHRLLQTSVRLRGSCGCLPMKLRHVSICIFPLWVGQMAPAASRASKICRGAYLS